MLLHYLMSGANESSQRDRDQARMAGCKAIEETFLKPMTRPLQSRLDAIVNGLA